MMEFVAIRPTAEENEILIGIPECRDNVYVCIDYYKVIGFQPPWICYFVKLDGVLVGNAAYKGKPIDNKIEIAYGTFPQFQNRGIATQICRELVRLAQETDPSVIITARTLPQENYSTKLLRKNNFYLQGTVWDKDDGEVWEWVLA